jgi:hypothetical protein
MDSQSVSALIESLNLTTDSVDHVTIPSAREIRETDIQTGIAGLHLNPGMIVRWRDGTYRILGSAEATDILNSGILTHRQIPVIVTSEIENL